MDLESSMPLDESKSVETVAKLIRDGLVKRIVVMIGPGISISAGVPDFRTPGTGLYPILETLNLPDPQAIFDISYFRNNPLPFYIIAHELYPGKFRPTIAHSFIRLLSDKGLLLKLLTQNTDCLEREAGVPDSLIMEQSGSFAHQHCIECKAPYPDDLMKNAVERYDVPHCIMPQCNGIVKPNINFRGEQWPDTFYQSTSLLYYSYAHLYISIGTGLGPGFPSDVILVNDCSGASGSRPEDNILLDNCNNGVRQLASALGWLNELELLWEKTALHDNGNANDSKEKTVDEALEDKLGGLAIVKNSVKEESENFRSIVKTDNTDSKQGATEPIIVTEDDLCQVCSEIDIDSLIRVAIDERIKHDYKVQVESYQNYYASSNFGPGLQDHFETHEVIKGEASIQEGDAIDDESSNEDENTVKESDKIQNYSETFGFPVLTGLIPSSGSCNLCRMSMWCPETYLSHYTARSKYESEYELHATQNLDLFIMCKFENDWPMFEKCGLVTALRLVTARRLEDTQYPSVTPVQVDFLSIPKGVGSVRSLKSDSVDFTILQSWIQFCQDNHTKSCRTSTSTSHKPNIKLIDCETRKLVDSNNLPYLTLSYMWGRDSGPVEYSEELPDLSMLPHTIKDSITVTLKLGFRYLWIDRYCINQSDKKAAYEQIRQMDSIYSNSEVTIVALAGEGPSYGLPGIGNCHRRRQSRFHIGQHCFAGPFRQLSEVVSCSRWASRGWTFQEWLLSTRRLIFTDEQVYYECNRMCCYEAIDIPLKNFRKDFFEIDSSNLFELIGQYSERSLTKTSDRLRGFLGVLNYFGITRNIRHHWGTPIPRVKGNQDFDDEDLDNDDEIEDENDEDEYDEGEDDEDEGDEDEGDEGEDDEGEDDESEDNEGEDRVSEHEDLANRDENTAVNKSEGIPVNDESLQQYSASKFIGALHFQRLPTTHITRIPELPSWSWTGWYGEIYCETFVHKGFYTPIQTEVAIELKDGQVINWDSFHNQYDELNDSAQLSHFIHITAFVALARVDQEKTSDGYVQCTFRLKDGYHMRTVFDDVVDSNASVYYCIIWGRRSDAVYFIIAAEIEEGKLERLGRGSLEEKDEVLTPDHERIDDKDWLLNHYGEEWWEHVETEYKTLRLG